MVGDKLNMFLMNHVYDHYGLGLILLDHIHSPNAKKLPVLSWSR